MPHPIRQRQLRQVSWGPPPIAQNNTTQLPYKIDETDTATNGHYSPKLLRS